MMGNNHLLKSLKALQPRGDCNDPSNKTQQGFTLLEVLIVVFMVGILAAIGTPSWVSMINNTKLKKAIAPIEQAIRQAQSKAKQQKTTWQASFQETTDAEGDLVVQWSVHPENSAPIWQTIDKKTQIIIDSQNTTLGSETSPMTIKFDDKGNVDPEDQLGRLTISLQSNANKRRCVKAITILGAMRTAQNDECTTEDNVP